MPEWKARSLLLEREEVEVTPNPSVVALLGLLQHLKVFFQLFLIWKRDPVNALKLRIFAITTPVRSSQF